MAVNNIDSLNSNLANAHTLTAKESEYVQEAEVDGIEILVNMARQGKIDPWNVDIVEVTDKYLMHLFQSKAQNLRLTGRTLFGAPAPKGQELEDQYFGAIKENVGSFMKDLNRELWKLGITATTQHNEVAPGQHEMAPIYMAANIAVDNNLLAM